MKTSIPGIIKKNITQRTRNNEQNSYKHLNNGVVATITTGLTGGTGAHVRSQAIELHAVDFAELHAVDFAVVGKVVFEAKVGGVGWTTSW